MKLLLDGPHFHQLLRGPDRESLATLKQWTEACPSLTALGWDVLQLLPLHYVQMANAFGERRHIGLEGLDVLVRMPLHSGCCSCSFVHAKPWLVNVPRGNFFKFELSKPGARKAVLLLCRLNGPQGSSLPSQTPTATVLWHWPLRSLTANTVQTY